MIRSLVERYIQFKCWWIYGRHYHSNIKPFELLRINPNDVEYFCYKDCRKNFNQPDYIPEVVGGNWDKEIVPVQSYDLYRAIQNRFIKGSDWEKTEFHDRITNELSLGKTKFGCNNIDEFEYRLSNIDSLYEDIKKNGYKRQREVEKTGDVYTDRVPSKRPPEINEITINITRSGEFVLHEGRHRLFITQLIKHIDKIPVRVKVRHEEWMQKRDEVIQNKITDIKHPDFDHLV